VSIIPYTFPETGTPVRVIGTADAPLFHHGDVCKILQHTNPSVAARMLDDDESVMIDMRDITAGQTALNPDFPAPNTGNATARFVTEPGLYSLILSSRAPGAKAFRRWLTSEVIPSIRRTGSYSVPTAPVQVLPDMATPEGRRAVAAALLAAADREIELNERVAELEPKALAHDTYLSAQAGERLVREVAKLLGWRQQDLRRFLVEERLVFSREALCGATVWDFYAANARHFRSVEHPVDHRWGRCSHYTLYVRPEGVDLIQKRIAKRQAEMAAAIGGAL
jgi:prophage antirepressor-like protein